VSSLEVSRAARGKADATAEAQLWVTWTALTGEPLPDDAAALVAGHPEVAAAAEPDLGIRARAVETDREGRIARGTHVSFPVKLGGRPLRFDCRPADPPLGYLHTTTRTGSNELEGSFQLEITICKNAISGKTAGWPYQPLKVSGSFAGLSKSTEN